MTFYAILACWILIGILCVLCFIRVVLDARIEDQTKRDAFLLWVVCPFQSLHGATLDVRHEWRQNAYMVGLVFLWPALLFLSPIGVRRYLRENGA